MPRKDIDLGQVDVIEYLEDLGCRNVEQASQEEAIFSCPFPGHSHGDESPSAYMNLENTKWMCHGCKKRGNAISFLADLERISPILAKRYIRERFEISFREPQNNSILEEVNRKFQESSAPKGNITLDDEHLEEQQVDWQAWEKMHEQEEIIPEPAWYMLETRGFDALALDEWEIGYDKISDRISIPVHDEKGHLVGFKGRAWRDDHKPKYLVLGDRPERKERFGYPCYLISQILYGAWRARPNEKGQIIVVEGELNVVAMWEMGFENVVAANGSNFSERQAQILLDLAEEVIVFFDSEDEAGNIGTKLVVNTMLPQLPVRVVPEHEGDPASLDMDSVEGLVADAHRVLLPW